VVLQRCAIQKLHGDKRIAVLVVNFIDSANVRVIQCRGGLGLTLKAAKGLWIFGNIIGQKLKSNEPAKLYVFSLINHTHPAAAQLLHNAVMRNGLADHEGSRSRRP